MMVIIYTYQLLDAADHVELVVRRGWPGSLVPDTVWMIGYRSENEQTDYHFGHPLDDTRMTIESQQ